MAGARQRQVALAERRAACKKCTCRSAARLEFTRCKDPTAQKGSGRNVVGKKPAARVSEGREEVCRRQPRAAPAAGSHANGVRDAERENAPPQERTGQRLLS